MLCKKCGKDIPYNTKFCGYCGNPVENDQLYNETLKEETIGMGERNNLELDNNLDQNLNAVDDIYINTNDENSDKTNKNNKKNNNVLFIILGAILLCICASLVVISINRTERGSIN